MTGVSTLGQALDQIERIKEQQAQFAQLSLQVTSGKKTQSFTGLGNDILISKRAHADFNSLDAYINNIVNANRRIALMSNAIAQFKEQARNFLGAMTGFSQQSVHQEGDDVVYDDPLTLNVVENTKVGKTSDVPDVDFKNLRAQANNIFEFMSDLLNVKDGDRYLLSGADTLTQPFTDNGTMDSAISNLLTQWKTGAITNTNLFDDLSQSDATVNPSAITDTTVGYSAALSAGNAGQVFVRVQQNAEINYTTLANDPAFRDIMVAISYIRSDKLPPIADTYIPPNTYPGVPDVDGAPGADTQEMKDNFFDVFNNLTKMVHTAIDRMDQLSFNLENAAARISEIKDNHTQDKNVLQNTIGEVENVDINEVAVKLNSMQNQIDASMAVTARMQQLSLVNFLFQ